MLDEPHQEARALVHYPSMVVAEVVAFLEDFQMEHWVEDPAGVEVGVEVHEVGQEALVAPLELKYHLVLLEEVVVCLPQVAWP